MRNGIIREMNALAESQVRTVILEADGLTVDDHLQKAHEHAKAHLQATQNGDHKTALHHSHQAQLHTIAARGKERQEEDPSKHQGEKMVFGVWRKVGQKLSSGEHSQLAKAHATMADRTKKRLDTRALLAGTDPANLSPEEKDQHYGEVKGHLQLAAHHGLAARGAHDYDPHGHPDQQTPEKKQHHASVMGKFHSGQPTGGAPVTPDAPGQDPQLGGGYAPHVAIRNKVARHKDDVARQDHINKGLSRGEGDAVRDWSVKPHTNITKKPPAYKFRGTFAQAMADVEQKHGKGKHEIDPHGLNVSPNYNPSGPPKKSESPEFAQRHDAYKKIYGDTPKHWTIHPNVLTKGQRDAYPFHGSYADAHADVTKVHGVGDHEIVPDRAQGASTKGRVQSKAPSDPPKKSESPEFAKRHDAYKKVYGSTPKHWMVHPNVLTRGKKDAYPFHGSYADAHADVTKAHGAGDHEIVPDHAKGSGMAD